MWKHFSYHISFRVLTPGWEMNNDSSFLESFTSWEFSVLSKTITKILFLYPMFWFVFFCKFYWSIITNWLFGTLLHIGSLVFFSVNLCSDSVARAFAYLGHLNKLDLRGSAVLDSLLILNTWCWYMSVFVIMSLQELNL